MGLRIWHPGPKLVFQARGRCPKLLEEMWVLGEDQEGFGAWTWAGCSLQPLPDPLPALGRRAELLSAVLLLYRLRCQT